MIHTLSTHDAPSGVSLRRVDPDRDPAEIAALHRRTREFMRPFDPGRPDAFFTEDGVRERIRAAHAEHGERLVDWLILLDGAAVDAVTIGNIVRGPFQSAHLGYSVEERHNGRGIATSAVRRALDAAFDQLLLHRVEAGTLTDNIASQRVLDKCGFVRIGISPNHLCIAGEWRDHVLFARTKEMRVDVHQRSTTGERA